MIKRAEVILFCSWLFVIVSLLKNDWLFSKNPNVLEYRWILITSYGEIGFWPRMNILEFP